MTMKTPIPLPVKYVSVRHTAPGDWTADVTFGIPDDSAHDDPTITINSGEGMELPPKAGDILIVRPPEIIGYANYAKGLAKPVGKGWSEPEDQGHANTDYPHQLFR
jgi:hypothetical protein